MAYEVDFKNVVTDGLESSPVAEKLAGLRANEARYFWNKYKYVYTTYPAAEKPDLVALIKQILKEERDLVFESPILEVALYEDDDLFGLNSIMRVAWSLIYSMKNMEPVKESLRNVQLVSNCRKGCRFLLS